MNKQIWQKSKNERHAFAIQHSRRWYRKYVRGDTVLGGLKNEAREARKELWANLQPVPQWGIAKGMSPHPLRRYMDFLC